MMMARALSIALLLIAVACDSDTPVDADVVTDGDGDVDVDADADEDGDSDAEQPPDIPFAVTDVEPHHGIFTGFTEVLVRGRGFESGAEVFFGETPVAPESTAFVDENRIACLTPPGTPDSFADIRVVQGEEEAVLAAGFYYDPCTLSPDLGAAVGGTYVVISCIGTEFESGVTVTFDGAEATGVERVGPTELHLFSPPGVPGTADVVIHSVTGDVELEDAFTYYANTDPTSGGLGGGAIEGGIEVTVLDGGSGMPLSDSFVIVGVDSGTEYQGWTDETGQIVFYGEGLVGRQVIITVSHGPKPTPIEYACLPGSELDPDGDGCCDDEGPPTTYQTASFTEFDATFVTVLLAPIPPMLMIMPCDSPPDPVISYVEGEVMFEHRGEFGPYEWEIVPEPIPPHEFKVTYVQTTARDIFYDPYPYGLDTFETGTVDAEDCGDLSCNEVLYDTEEYRGENGYTYRIRSRNGAVAVYAIAGIYSSETNSFTPYAFGVRRGVMVSPGERVEDADIMMVTPLDETVFVALEEAPEFTIEDRRYDERTTPLYEVDLFVDLGIEGVIWRRDRRSTREFPEALHAFSSWMPRDGALADTTLIVVASHNTYVDQDGDGEFDDLSPEPDGVPDPVPPISTRYVQTVTDWQADVVVDEWLDIAHEEIPDFLGTLTTPHIEWENGAGEAHYNHVNLYSCAYRVSGTTIEITGLSPYWDMILPGEQSTVDLPTLPEEFEPSSDLAYLQLYRHRVQPGFDFDLWAYDDLNRDVQEGYSVSSWYFYLDMP